MTTLILIPTLGRIGRLRDVVANVDDATPEDHLVVFVVEHHEFVATIEALQGLDVDVLGNCQPGHYGAYNWALEVYSKRQGWDAWFHGADDLRFHDGWLGRCRRQLEAGMVAGTNDLLSRRVANGNAATHYLVHRGYVATNPLPGVSPPAAYFGGYHHQFGETEFIDHARRAGRFVPCVDAIVEHLHPLAGKAEHDATYAHGQAHASDDEELYRARCALT